MIMGQAAEGTEVHPDDLDFTLCLLQSRRLSRDPAKTMKSVKVLGAL